MTREDDTSDEEDQEDVAAEIKNEKSEAKGR